MAVTVDMPALDAFRTVPPRKDIKLSDYRLPDGSPMIGPGTLLVPAARSVQAVYNAANRIFSYRFDEAMRDNWVNARAMKRDGFLQGLFDERTYSTINRDWVIEVDDDRDKRQMYVRDNIKKIVQAVPDLSMLKAALLEGVWFGRAGVQGFYQRNEDTNNFWVYGRNSKCRDMKWAPVHGDSVQYTFDGVPAILMDSMVAGWYAQNGAKWGGGYREKFTQEGQYGETWGSGDLRYTDRGGPALVLQREFWRERFLIHQHKRVASDYFEGELAGSIQGLGLRGMVYWQYVLRTDCLGWMISYMQAVGAMDFLIFNYPANDAAAKAQAEANANSVIGKAAMVCPRKPDGNWQAVEQLQMNSTGLKALQELVSDYFDRHIERLFVGQSMSAGADKGTGLGGTGRADFCRSCVPTEGSEILTRRGFVKPHDAVIGEEVLAYDAETDTCKWTPLLKKSFYDDAEVVRMFNTQGTFDFVCTSDHSWAVEKSNTRKTQSSVTGLRGGSRSANPTRYLQKADQIRFGESVILSARENETIDSLLTSTEAAVLGWLVTDGTIREYTGRYKGRRYSAGICQSKECHFDCIRKLTSDLVGHELHETVITTKQRTFPTNGKTYSTKPQRWWYLPREVGTNLLNKCGFHTRADLPGIVTRLSGESRRAMLQAMMQAEGNTSSGKNWTDKQSFANTDIYVLEAFDILCALEGIAVGKPQVQERGKYKTCVVKVLKKSRHAHRAYLKIEPAGRCDVWCPTTKYGTWIMRQNGRVVQTGNTKDEILFYDSGRLDEVLTNDLIRPLVKYNFPWAKFSVRYKSVLSDPKKKEKVDSGKVMISLGIPIKVDEIREAADFSRPEDGDEVLIPAGPGGPPILTTMGPNGPNVPMMGSPPPEPGQDDPGFPGPPPGPPGLPPGFPPGGPLMGGPPNIPPSQPGLIPGPMPGRPVLPPQSQMQFRDPTPGVPPMNGPVLGPPRSPFYNRQSDPTRYLGYPGGGNTFIPSFGGSDWNPGRNTVGMSRNAQTDYDLSTNPTERQRDNQILSQAPATSEGSLNGTGEVEKIKLPDGMNGVFKPTEGETDAWRFSVPKQTYALREVAAARTAELLGFSDLVPPTTWRTEDGESGSVQEFVTGRDAESVSPERREGKGSDLVRAAIFDYITGQLDRHTGNWVIQKDDRLTLIDNGIAFPVEYVPEDWFVVPLWKMALGETVPDFSGLIAKWPALVWELTRLQIEPQATQLMGERLWTVANARGTKFGDLPFPANPELSMAEWVDSQDEHTRSDSTNYERRNAPVAMQFGQKNYRRGQFIPKSVMFQHTPPRTSFNGYPSMPAQYADATDHESFHTAINSGDRNAAKVYADLLDEEGGGAPGTAHFLRTHEGPMWVSHHPTTGDVYAGHRWTMPEIEQHMNSGVGGMGFLQEDTQFHGEPIHGPGGIAFITSERPLYRRRGYTVRLFDPEQTSIDHFALAAHPNQRAAESVSHRLVNGLGVDRGNPMEMMGDFSHRKDGPPTQAARYERTDYADQSTLQGLLRAAREDPDDTTRHGVIADTLDELHPGNHISGLLRRQYGLGEYGGRGEQPTVNEFGPFYAGFDGAHPYFAHIGQHGPFNLYLGHEGISPHHSRWVVRAESRLPGSEDTAYHFEFPHKEAHLIPQMFPAAKDHISPYQGPHRLGGRIPQHYTEEEWRNRESRLFTEAMDEQERNRE